MKEISLIDTNILVYAYDSSEGLKHQKSRKLIEECFEGIKKFAVSNQILAEFFYVMSKKMESPLNLLEIYEILEEIIEVDNWKKIDYNYNTVIKTVKSKPKHFWDSLIAETMKENGIQKIYTENTRHFEKIPGITVVNPFK